MPADTGNGTTLSLATTGAVGNIRSVNGHELALGKLEDSHLGTTDSKTYIPDDLEEPGEVEFEVEFDTSVAEPARGVVETATLTYPLRTGESSAATEIGTGFITSVKKPDNANGSIQVMRIKFAFDGKTGPAFTVSS